MSEPFTTSVAFEEFLCDLSLALQETPCTLTEDQSHFIDAMMTSFYQDGTRAAEEADKALALMESGVFKSTSVDPDLQTEEEFKARVNPGEEEFQLTYGPTGAEYTAAPRHGLRVRGF